MQLGMIGLDRMGTDMVSRLLHGGHQCVVFDTKTDSVKELASKGATGVTSLEDFAAKLKPLRALWLMVPAVAAETTLHDLAGSLHHGDTIIDGGNSYYIDDIRRAILSRRSSGLPAQSFAKASRMVRNNDMCLDGIRSHVDIKESGEAAV